MATLTAALGRFDSGVGTAGVVGLTPDVGSVVAGCPGRFLARDGSGVGTGVVGITGWPGCGVGTVAVFGVLPRFFMPSVVGGAGCPGLINVESAGTTGWPGFTAAASVGFTGCPGLPGFVKVAPVVAVAG